MATTIQGRRGAVLITGAAGGVGVATVCRLVEMGFQVFAGVRRITDGEALRREIGGEVTPILLDVTDATSIAEAAEVVSKAVGSAGLLGLVNNAGIIVEGPFELTPVEEVRKQFEVSVIGQVAVTQAMLPQLRKARGRVINVGAVSGRVALPYYGVISAAKTALEAFSDALRGELRPWGIGVSIIEPGAMQTKIFAKAESSGQQARQQFSKQQQELYAAGLAALSKAMANQHMDAPDVAVNAIIHALTARRPKTRYPVGRGARVAVMLRFLPDRLRDGMLLRLIGIADRQVG